MHCHFGSGLGTGLERMAGSDGERCNSAGTAKNGGTLPEHPHAPLMISLVATLPALFIALLAAPFGLLADRVGRRILLFIGLAVYGVLGIAPYWLNSLQWIVASRAGVGVTEAMVTTCSTALIVQRQIIERVQSFPRPIPTPEAENVQTQMWP
jgi:MFS family permease